VDPWIVGLIAVTVVGLAVILFGALSDRAKNKRAAAEMMAPPQRVIPQFHPDSPTPHYLSELQARRRPEGAESSELTSTERDQIAQQVKDPATIALDVGYASRDFITDRSSSWAVLDSPSILVCSEPIGSTRELLTILEKLMMSRTPLVIVAPSLAPEVRGTLEVNQIQQTMRLVAVTAEEQSQQLIAVATDAQPLSRSDLQAGYVRPEHLGTCARWVSTAKKSFLIGAVPDHRRHPA
jgi:hypothetical protein